MTPRRERIIQHYREAKRLRAVAAGATTPAMRARLLEKAEEYDRLAAEELTPVEA